MKFLKAVIYSASDLKCSKHYSVTAKNYFGQCKMPEKFYPGWFVIWGKNISCYVDGDLSYFYVCIFIYLQKANATAFSNWESIAL